jgi:hypothetical protein
MITPYSGKTSIEYFPKKASQVLAIGAALKFDGSGAVTIATNADTSIAGIGIKKVAAADSDYASTTSIPCIMVKDDATFLADVGAGTLTAALVGTTCDLHTDAASIAASTDTHHQVTIVGFVDSLHALIKFNSNYAFKNAS